MTDEDLLNVLPNCSENDLEDMIDRGFLKNINEEQLKSLLSNPNFDISLLALEELCDCPYTSGGSIKTTQYQNVFNLIKIYQPNSIESALEEYFIDN